jgi:cell division septum initiation protein DivIVA
MKPKFEITMGGYDRTEVDGLVEAVSNASDPEALLRILRSKQAEKFPRRFRGYSKIQVHNFIEDRIREFSRETGRNQAP